MKKEEEEEEEGIHYSQIFCFPVFSKIQRTLLMTTLMLIKITDALRSSG